MIGFPRGYVLFAQSEESNQMCIHPQLKIVPDKSTVYCSLVCVFLLNYNDRL